jgi:catechol 2,3-dioxygenase-like lactoylglutathione lyase family enzyme
LALTGPDLDHLAVGVRSIDEAVRWAATGMGGGRGEAFVEGSWRGVQVAFARGIRLEALEPIDNPEDNFLTRFLEHTGEGPHHATFKVPDIAARIEKLRAIGIEPVKMNLASENWKEAFLHPKLGLGTVIQIAQPSGEWSGDPPRTEIVDGVSSEFLGAELRGDPDQAERVLGGVLEGQAADVPGGRAYSWPGGGSLLVRPVESDGKPGVERFVFRVLEWAADRHAPTREAPLYAGPATLVRLARDEPWPVGTVL